MHLKLSQLRLKKNEEYEFFGARPGNYYGVPNIKRGRFRWLKHLGAVVGVVFNFKCFGGC